MTTDHTEIVSTSSIIAASSSSQFSTVHLTSTIVATSATSTAYVQSTPLPSVTITPLVIGPSSVGVQSTRVAMDTSREGVMPTGLPDSGVNVQQGEDRV